MASLGSLLLLLLLSVCGAQSELQTACNDEFVSITCSDDNSSLIHVSDVLYGFLKQTESPSNDTISCANLNLKRDCLKAQGNSSIVAECHGQPTCKTLVRVVTAEYSCNKTDYQNSSYVLVVYTCENNLPTTTSAPTTTTTAAMTTRWAPPTTTEYVNFLSTGAQAGIIVAIMVGLTIIFAAITVYKCVKYGPSDDTRKFFSKAPEPGAIDDPKIIPWVPGEAQEEIYRNITEKAKAKSKKKRKFKF